MGKASETGDDVAMALGIMEKTREKIALPRGGLLQQPAKQLHRALLQFQIFGMFERQVEENPLQGGEAAIALLREPLQNQARRLFVAGVGVGPIAVDIA